MKRNLVIGLLLGGSLLPGCVNVVRDRQGGVLGGVARFLAGEPTPPVVYMPPQPPPQVQGAPELGGPSCGPNGMDCMHSHYVCRGQHFVAEIFSAGDAQMVRPQPDARYDYLCVGRPEGWFVYPPHGEPQPPQ